MELVHEAQPLYLRSTRRVVLERKVKAKTITFPGKKNLQDCDISANSNYNFEKPLLGPARKLFGSPDLKFVAAPALAPSTARADETPLAQHAKETDEASAMPLPGEDEDDDLETGCFTLAPTLQPPPPPIVGQGCLLLDDWRYCRHLTGIRVSGKETRKKKEKQNNGKAKHGYPASGNGGSRKTTAWVAPIEDSPKPPPKRITLTLPVMTHAVRAACVATGGGKKGVMMQIFEEGGASGLPSALVNKQTSHLCSWFINKPTVEGVSYPKRGFNL